jgi:hypothetical protein
MASVTSAGFINTTLEVKLAVFDERIRKYLAKCPPAVSGSNGHTQTFKVACSLVWGFALPRDQALFYLELYNQTCEPPWFQSELEHKIDSSFKAKNTKPVGYLICSRS